MPYIDPTDVVNDTLMPTAFTPYKDLLLECKLLKEQWKRYYPIVPYYMIKLINKQAVDDLAGDMPNTVVDDMWGEAVPQSALLKREWHQPHGNTPEADILDATTATKYHDRILVNARVEIVDKKRELGAFGMNMERDLSLVIPTALLDEVGLVIANGDYFIWNKTKYEIVDYEPAQLWKNTDVFLFITCYAKRMELGS